MDLILKGLPQRSSKPRETGLCMMMDKGMSVQAVQNVCSVACDYLDIVKLGFGTSILTRDVTTKIKYYREHGIPCFLGGTLFEAFIVRDQYEDYLRLMDSWEIKLVEVSDGSIHIPHDEKCKYIADLKSKGYTVLSEVGSKDAAVKASADDWIKWMHDELDAGAWKVIGEARESGTVGVFEDSGEIKMELLQRIVESVPSEKIIWEAPQKEQQVWFIKKMGPNVNIGNIAPEDIIPLETLRLGLRGDTFHDFLK